MPAVLRARRRFRPREPRARKAVKDGDEWHVTGQKVWTSTAQLSNVGMLIARTDPDLPKHKGITYFKFDMTQPGVEIRPLREMTGRAMFNEVFIDNAIVHDDDMIGGLNNGWAATNTTLMAERAGLGTGGIGRGRQRVPRTDRGPAQRPRRRPRRPGPHRRHRRRRRSRPRNELMKLAQGARPQHRAPDPPEAREALHDAADRPVLGAARQVAEPAHRRRAEHREADDERPAAPAARGRQRDHRRERAWSWAPTRPAAGSVQELTLFSPGPSIYGGTDQVQRNIIGERVLGLPKEPGPAEGHAVPRPAGEHAKPTPRPRPVLDQLLATPGVQERCVLGLDVRVPARCTAGSKPGTAEIAAGGRGRGERVDLRGRAARRHALAHPVAPLRPRAVGRAASRSSSTSTSSCRCTASADCAATTTAGSPALLGGSNRELAAELAAQLRDALPGYRWIDDLERIPSHLRGVHPRQPGEPGAAAAACSSSSRRACARRPPTAPHSSARSPRSRRLSRVVSPRVSDARWLDVVVAAEDARGRGRRPPR